MSLPAEESLSTERLPRGQNQIASTTLQKCCTCNPGASRGVRAYGCSMVRMAKHILSAASADLGLLECHNEIIESSAAKGHCSPLVSSVCATKTEVT